MITDLIYTAKNIFDNNVLNIDAERYFREAEDYYFYFDRSDLALKMLKKALKLSPSNIKSLKLTGDIYYSLGKMQKAFDYYSQAAALQPSNSVILSSLATVCEALKKFSTALDFINLAFKNYTNKETRIYAQMCDLKISLLIKLQRYSEAKKFLDGIQKVLPFEDAMTIAAANNSETLKKKLSLRERMDNLSIKVV